MAWWKPYETVSIIMENIKSLAWQLRLFARHNRRDAVETYHSRPAAAPLYEINVSSSLQTNSTSKSVFERKESTTLQNDWAVKYKSNNSLLVKTISRQNDMVFTKAARAELRGHDEHWLRQSLLRSSLSICSTVAIVCYTWAVTSSNLFANYGGNLLIIGLVPVRIRFLVSAWRITIFLQQSKGLTFIVVSI